MTTGKIAIALALLAVTGCARTDQLACGPALPPIAAAPVPVVATPVAATPVVAAPMAVMAPVAPGPDQRFNANMENRAAAAGR